MRLGRYHTVRFCVQNSEFSSVQNKFFSYYQLYLRVTEIGEQLLKDFAAKCADIATLDKNPKLEGRNMSMFLSPKPQTPAKKPAKPKAPKPQEPKDE